MFKFAILLQTNKARLSKLILSKWSMTLAVSMPESTFGFFGACITDSSKVAEHLPGFSLPFLKGATKLSTALPRAEGQSCSTTAAVQVPQHSGAAFPSIRIVLHVLILFCTSCALLVSPWRSLVQGEVRAQHHAASQPCVQQHGLGGRVGLARVGQRRLQLWEAAQRLTALKHRGEAWERQLALKYYLVNTWKRGLFPNSIYSWLLFQFELVKIFFFNPSY